MGRLPGRLLARQTSSGTKALAIAGAAVLVMAAGAVLAAGWPPEPANQIATVAAAGESRATLRVAAGTPLLVVRMTPPGDNGTLARAETPSGAPVRPQLRETNRKDADVELSLTHGGGSGRGSYPVTVTLSRAVTWALVFAGGTDRTVADLRGGHVAVLLFSAGSDVIDVTLPRPRGTVPVILAGGAGRFLVRLPGGVPARVTAGGGAGEVVLDGMPRTGVAGGTVLSSPGWPGAGPRFDVDAVAGAALISVTRWRG
jgi:hypothetical protein